MHAADPALDSVSSAFGVGAIGGAASPEVDAWIAQAGLLRERPEEAMALLEKARAAAPSHPGPLIALYRFHFYGHRLTEARAAGEDALAIARTALGPDFGDRPPPDEAARHDAAVRFYLFTLKGLAYLNMRLGAMEEARTLLRELRRLDPRDNVGGSLLSHVLARHATSELPGSGESLAEYPLRGWDGVVW